MSKGYTALIDGDIVVYRSGFSAEHTIYTLRWTDELGDNEAVFEYKKPLNAFLKERDIIEYDIIKNREVEPLENALYSVKKTLQTIQSDVKAKDSVIFLSKGENFRHKAATISKYKGNRDNQARPTHYDDIHEYLIKYHGAIVCKGIEADDALADAQADNTVLCSIDKDLLQVPGKHYNWVRQEKLLVSPEIGMRTLWCQVLTGDGTDNIPGIVGVGEITAKKLMAECTTEEEYRAVAIEQWAKFLYESPPPWVQYAEQDEDTTTVHYKHWDENNKDVQVATVEDIVNEVLELVTVGGRRAARND